MPKLNLPCVAHGAFGIGFVFGQRVLDIGIVKGVFFVDAESVATIQADFLTAAPRPDVPKTLRAAYSAYKKAHGVKKAARTVAEAPIELDEDAWRKTFEFEGREEELTEVA